MDVLRPKILNVDGRKYRLNTADCCPNDCDATETDKAEIQIHNTEAAESLPSYVERDGEILKILLDNRDLNIIYFISILDNGIQTLIADNFILKSEFIGNRYFKQNLDKPFVHNSQNVCLYKMFCYFYRY